MWTNFKYADSSLQFSLLRGRTQHAVVLSRDGLGILFLGLTSDFSSFGLKSGSQDATQDSQGGRPRPREEESLVKARRESTPGRPGLRQLHCRHPLRRAVTPMPVLRPFQMEALQALTRRRSHVLCVSATGSGKSLIYERFAARLGVRTLLITPLLALARQQCASLRTQGILTHLGAGANSEPAPEGSGVWILSPENLLAPSTQRKIARWQPNFLVVDECHCIWEWGSQFRPAFREIPMLLKLPSLNRSLWLTATIPLEARLELRESVFPIKLQELGDFELPEKIELSIHRIPWPERDQAVLAVTSQLDGPGIIFVFSRGQAEGVARLLRAAGHKAAAYHAGISLEEKRALEATFACASGPRILVGTSALGLGLDLKDLRWVLLRQAPLSALALAQSIGRVARGPAGSGRAIVFWSEGDFQLLAGIAGATLESKKNLQALHELLQARECRRVSLSRYFKAPGQRLVPCGRCDHCNSCQ